MIPEAAVEAAVEAHCEGTMLAALEAAAPHMLAEIRSHVVNQILAANNAEGFTEFAAGWVAALKNVHDRIPK